ncbi:hypothetical protein X560_0376 [Listeria fleischmannii 1991]|uniref:Phage tail protein n=2 Tax=Listeria fleischmannii TaxID=1069827 RepID=A0A2X3GR10_9LIST|nr:phage tail domain-containing protein [Listeria fleischmannii]EMG27081.1 phage protein [Listeria fleischmannii subsp. fleischmannii LU2006-1]KMT60956.1 hypothetical protein X560_0376 [Listeria fleischmannii 1991]SQC70602.1 Phage tail protein [Listeria fleischmannii subsp. fleischmannii]
MTKVWMDIIKKEGTIRITDQLPLYFIHEHESDWQAETNVMENSGIDGLIPGKNTFAPFTKTFTFVVKTRQSELLKMVKREIKKLVGSRESYFVRYEREPGNLFAIDNVKITWENEEKAMFAGAVLTLEFNVYKGYSESWATTLDPMLFSTNKWAIGLNLPLGEDLSYIHTDKTFRIYNASTDTIDPRMRHKLTIALSCEGQPTLTNETTGDYFTYYKALKKTDVLVLSGVYPYKNDTHCGKDTNHGVITLATGWNEFELTGAEEIEIKFDFPFVYR